MGIKKRSKKLFRKISEDYAALEARVKRLEDAEYHRTRREEYDRMTPEERAVAHDEDIIMHCLMNDEPVPDHLM